MSQVYSSGFSKSPQSNHMHDQDQDRDIELLDYDKIIEATDIESLVSEFVELRPQGSRMVGLCPFHNDTSPSFTVSPAKGVYGCWSCDAGLNGKQSGNAVSFVRRYFNLGYRDALVYLADRLGIPVDDRLRANASSVPKPKPTRSTSKPAAPRPVREDEPKQDADKAQVVSAMSRASHGYSLALRQSPEAIHYLTSTRGVAPFVLSQFAIGYAPNEFNFLRGVMGDNYDESRDGFDAGLLRLSAKGNRYDFFRNRLMFGLRNEKGEIIAFGGRAMGEEQDTAGYKTPKYINSPETAIFSKSNELFGLYENKAAIEQADMVLVVEGYMDVVALASQNIPLAVACMGTAMTDQHAQKLFNHARRIMFCFDADRAGQEAALRSMIVAINQGGLEESLRFVQLPDGNDPDTFVKQHGKTAFEREISNALTVTQFWRKALQSRFPNTSDADELWQFSEQLLRDMRQTTVKESLMHVAAKLANKPIEKTQSANTQRESTQKSFAPATPSLAVFQSVVMCPDAAKEVRGHLTQIAQAFATVKTVSEKWLAQFDAAISAGEKKPTTTPPFELEHYRRRVLSAPFVLQKVCESAQKKQKQEQMTKEGLDEREQIQEKRKSLFSRPN